MSTRTVLAATLLGVVATFVSPSPALASGPVKIAKIHYGQTGTNLNTEYIVFKNTSASAVQLKGWEIISAPSTDNQHYFFPHEGRSRQDGHPLHRLGRQRSRQALLGGDLVTLEQRRRQGGAQERIRHDRRHLPVRRRGDDGVLLTAGADGPAPKVG